jgi:chemotaxis protein methyltransferase CheR
LCQSAISADRLDSEAYRLLAAIQQERGEIAAAIEALRRALYLEPDAAEAHSALGHLLLKRGERRDGLRHIQTAARMHDERGDAR